MSSDAFRGPRTPVPARIEWSDLAGRFQALQDEPLEGSDARAWLIRWSDLEKELVDYRSRVFNAKSEDTSNSEAEAAFLHFLQGVAPQWQVASQALREKVIAAPSFDPGAENREWYRAVRNQASLYRVENVALQSEAAQVANEYSNVAGAWTVELDGLELTVPQAQQRLLEPDRELRERAWRAMEERKGRDRATLDGIYLRLVGLRRRIAANAGEPDFRAYTFKALNRFDYGPDDAIRYQEAIASEVVPVLARLREERREQMGVESLRPWDIQVDPLSRPPLKPFASVVELEEGLSRIFRTLDPELAAIWDGMREAGTLDLEPRKSKVPGLGYSTNLPVTNQAYIYWSAVGTDRDVSVMLHEAGHAFHFVLSMRAQPHAWNALSAIEFAEVGSQGMELLALPYLGKDAGGFYDAEDAGRWRLSLLESVLLQMAMPARGDAFQNWVYTEAPEDLTGEQLDAKWLELTEKYAPGIDYGGLEAEVARGWQAIGHFYATPFYYIEYGLAWLGALQLWRNSLTDREGALRQYKEALALGGTRGVRELFEAAGASFRIDRETIGGLARFLEEQIALAKT